MASSKLRIGAITAVALLLLLGVLAGATSLVRRHVEARALQALGPRAHVGAMVWGWHEVELQDLRISAAGAGPAGAAPAAPIAWPAADELRAGRVVLRFDWRSAWVGLTGGLWHVASVDVHGGYLSVLRTPQGRLRLLPAWLERPKPLAVEGDARPAPIGWRVDTLRVDGATLDLYDAAPGAAGPRRFTLERVQARVAPWGWPTVDGPVAVDLRGDLSGARRQGRMAVRGSVAPASQDARLSVSVENADLSAFQPYWSRLGEAGVAGGRLDMTLEASVAAGVVHAPGTLTLAELELQTRSGVLGALAGMAREAELAALGRNGRVAVRFTLQGPLAHPALVIDDAPRARVASVLGEALGIGVGGLARGVGGVVNGLLGN